jgi:maltose alpha-D-glucosyltransferase/alpha-amylase
LGIFSQDLTDFLSLLAVFSFSLCTFGGIILIFYNWISKISLKMKKTVLAMALALTMAGSVSAQSGVSVKGPAWLSNAVFYQIYPSSYMDTDGNGIGDLPGITEKLDYIKSLGVNAIWLNPVFESGWFDGGYDVIDFYKIDPRFGTNTDMVNLIREAHKRGIKVCLDLVAGHTSNRCEWFKESANGDPNGHYADYYIWTDTISKHDKEEIALRHQSPNPQSSTRGRYVEINAPRAKYYEKNFFECQPALNYGFAHPDHSWEQPVTAPGPQAVRREIRNIMSFWFDKGVDGFRVDMASSLVKNDPGKVETSKLWREMRAWKDKHYPQCVLISEWSNPAEAIPAGFNIDFMIHFGIKGYASLFFAPDTPWGKSHKNDGYGECYFDKAGKGELKQFIDNFSNAYEKTENIGYIALPTANHDYQRPNIGTRNTFDQLKVTMTFFLTMPGVPFIYYGDEIGMKYQMNLPSKEGSNNRAGTRTPMQWTPGLTAGFSTCRPDQLYFPVATDNGRLTVAAQEKDKNSLLNFTRDLIRLRHSSPALDNDGGWQLVSDVDKPYPMVYKRTADDQTYIIALNPSDQKVSAKIAHLGKGIAKLVSGKVRYQSGKVSDTVKLNGISAAVFYIK